MPVAIERRRWENPAATPLMGSAIVGMGPQRLYQTPRNTNTQGFFRPRNFIAQDLAKAVSETDRMELVDYSRQIFAQGAGNIGAGIHQKACYAVGDAWKIQYIGDDPQWGEVAERWLNEMWAPMCDVRGPTFDFKTGLFLTSISLDVDGDDLMILTESQDGRFPMLKYVPTHRVGQRNGSETTVKSGPFAGFRITQGVIMNERGTAVGYRILGDKPEDDRDVSTFNADLCIEPEWCVQWRGLPRIARVLLDCFDIQDIDTFLKRQTKLASSIGLIINNEDGEADSAQDFIDTTVPAAGKDSAYGTAPEIRRGGEIFYQKAGKNESIETIKNDNPSPNVEAFISRIERRCLLAVGWFYELIDPSKIGGASVRLIQDQARHSIRNRQNALKRRALRAVHYAVGKGMKNGLIPRNDVDWWKFDFEVPAQITVDSGYDRASDIADLKLGLTTAAAINAKSGRFGQDVRKQRFNEVKGLLTDAQTLAQEFKITTGEALELLYQRNASPPLLTSGASNAAAPTS